MWTRIESSSSNFYSGNLVDCGPCKLLCVPPRYLLELDDEKGYMSSRSGSRAEHWGVKSDPLKALGELLMQEKIFSKLPSVDMGRCLAVCKSWKKCGVDDSVWKKRCERISFGFVIPWSRYYIMYKLLVRDVHQHPAAGAPRYRSMKNCRYIQP